MKKIQQMIDQLSSFSNDILERGVPLIDNALIIKFERKYNLTLPNDYKYIISQFNGINLMGVSILGLSQDNSIESLETVYDFEHFEVMYPQYNYLVPFSPDGGGNFYCFDTRFLKPNETDSCPIIFWQSNYPYSFDDEPEIVYEDLSDWIQEVMINWTLEQYDYNGNPI